MIIFDGGFLSEFFDNRIVCITGRLRSGKTLLALEVAETLLKQHYKLVCNFNTVWRDEYEDIELDDKCVGIVDEGGIYVRSMATSQKLGTFLGKMDSYLIFSGKQLPHENLTNLRLYLWFDFWKNLAIPLKVWRYEVNIQETKKYGGFLLQSGWQNTFGTYSTLDPGDFPDAVVLFFEERAKKLFDRYGRRYVIRDVARKSLGFGEDESVNSADDLTRVAEKVGNSLSLAARKGTKGKRN
ncbi:MAG TPA: hypothetical protein VMR41_05140 [Patescibacteria group bacterium]|jgi:hypothetical protein|nr:hypothetical protein [Patescibacteria group bacterium]